MSDDEGREAELRQAFGLFDKNGDGSIERKELANGLRALGGNPTDAEIELMLKEADGQMNANGKIEFNEFCDLMMNHLKSRDEEQESLKQAFKTFDRNGDGRIDKKELKIALTNLGFGKLTEDEVDDLFKQADADDNGYIDSNELIAIMTNSCN